jgi:hypothetical protein
MEACPTCGSIGDVETGFFKNGFPQYDAPLPAALGELEEVASNVSGGRGDTLYRCPACDGYFHYELDYEFIVPGTEDSETLRRIADEEAAVLRRRIGGSD